MKQIVYAVKLSCDNIKLHTMAIEEEIACYRTPIQSLLRDFILNVSSNRKSKCVAICIIPNDQNIVIEDLFDNWYDAELKDPTYLMRDMRGYNTTTTLRRSYGPMALKRQRGRNSNRGTECFHICSQ